MDPLSIPASRWVKTRETWQTRGRLQYWAPANNVRNDKGAIYTDNREQYGRDLGFADTLAPRRVEHQGWYCDQGYCDTIRGSVTRVRGARFTLYVPVTSCTGWDGTIHHMQDAERVPRGSSEEEHEQAIRDAAATADRCAELEAEQEREDSARDQAEQDIQEARATIHTLNREALELIKAIKASGRTFEAPICSALAHRARDLLADRAEQFETINKRTGDYWTAVKY